MEKQLTPIGKILKFCDDHEKMSDYAVGTDSLRAFAQSLCTEEREVIEKSYELGAHDAVSFEMIPINDAKEYAAQHFNETFKTEI